MATIHPPGTTLGIEVGGMAMRTAPLPEVGKFIGRNARTTPLYNAEERVVEAIKRAAVQQARLKGWAETEGADFYDRAVPAALAQSLEAFTPSVGVAAAVAYLQYHGIAVNIEPAG